MAGDLVIRLRRIGERRTWPLRRLRSEYEVVINDDGPTEIYRAKTIAPSAALVTKGNLHTTDAWDWVRAADEAYARNDSAWIFDPF